MSLSHCRRLAPLLVVLWLGGPVRAADGIEDAIGLFSASARDKARDEIEEIRHRTHKDVFIATVNRLTPDELKQYREKTSDTERARFFHELAEKRSASRGVNGVYVLLCRVPAVQEPGKGLFRFIPRRFTELMPPLVVGHAVVVRPAANDAYFPPEDRTRLDQMFADIRVADHNQDGVLLDAVKFTSDELTAHARALGAPPAETIRWTDVLGAALILAAGWVLLGSLRARAVARTGTSVPAVNPAMSAQYGAAAVLWLLEAYRARRQEAPAPPPPPAEADDMPPEEPPMHPDDQAALARGPAAWEPENTEAATGHDLP
jgi:hypothetical protein